MIPKVLEFYRNLWYTNIWGIYEKN
jgi:hypothetical protein